MSYNRPDELHNCGAYMQPDTVPDPKIKQCRPDSRIFSHKCKTSTIIFPPEPCYEEKVYMWKCIPPPPPPPPPPPDECKQQAIKNAIKEGKTICPKPPLKAEEYIPSPCPVFLCTEMVKNLPVVITKDLIRPVCVVQRVLPTTDRCDEIARKNAFKKDVGWPCPIIPPIPAPVLRNPCDVVDAGERRELCLERQSKYNKDLPQNRASPNAVVRIGPPLDIR